MLLSKKLLANESKKVIDNVKAHVRELKTSRKFAGDLGKLLNRYSRQVNKDVKKAKKQKLLIRKKVSNKRQKNLMRKLDSMLDDLTLLDLN